MPRRGDIVTEPEKREAVLGKYAKTSPTPSGLYDYFTFGRRNQGSYLHSPILEGFHKNSVLILVPVEFT